MEFTMQKYLLAESLIKEVVAFKPIYVDMANGDVIAGLLLSQIAYWNLPTKEGKQKLKVKSKGHYWLAKLRTDWYDEIRISPKQYDRAIMVLSDLKIVEVKNSLFNAKKTPFIRLLDGFYELFQKELSNNGISIELIINELKKLPYKEYLKSSHWKETRKRMFILYNHKCGICDSKTKLNVHHKNYTNKGCEKSEDLIVLCQSCHAKFHDKVYEE